MIDDDNGTDGPVIETPVMLRYDLALLSDASDDDDDSCDDDSIVIEVEKIDSLYWLRVNWVEDWSLILNEESMMMNDDDRDNDDSDDLEDALSTGYSEYLDENVSPDCRVVIHAEYIWLSL